MLYSDGLIQAA